MFQGRVGNREDEPAHVISEFWGKLAITVGAIVLVLIVGGVLRALANALLPNEEQQRASFWTAQTIHLLTLAGAIVVVVVVWRDSITQLGAVGGWIAAGLTVALQRVVTSFAGYLIILRGNVFSVGDRITIGGVRGDVVRLGFMQTTVLEMGEAPGEQGDKPSLWVQGRQPTGRLVRVTNDKIFDSPVYNYTRDFPYLWDEIHIPVRYGDDRAKVEQILLRVARQHTESILTEAQPRIHVLRDQYHIREPLDLEPKVYYRLTDNWVELSLRFFARDRDVRSLKDAMNRAILGELERANIGIASGTYAIVEFPTLTVRTEEGSSRPTA